MIDDARKPKIEQGFLEEMFDQETVQALKEAQADDVFPRVDENLETQYRCPACSYEWSGNPKPPIGVTIEDDGSNGDA